MNPLEPNEHQPGDEHIWHGLAVLNRIQSTQSLPKSFDEAIEKIKKELFAPQGPQEHLNRNAQGRIRATILRLTGRTCGTEALIEWLRRTGEFTEKDLKLIRRAKFFYEAQTGQVLMRQSGLSLEKATFLISILGFIAGGWAGYIWFENRTGIQEILYAYAAGTCIGTFAGILADRSFGFKRIRDKVEFIAPWLTQPMHLNNGKA